MESFMAVASAMLKRYLTSVRAVVSHVRSISKIDSQGEVRQEEEEWLLFQSVLRMLPVAGKIGERITAFTESAFAELQSSRGLLLESRAADSLFDVSSERQSACPFTPSEVIRSRFCRGDVDEAGRANLVKFLESEAGTSAGHFGGVFSGELDAAVDAMDSIAFESIFGRVRRLLGVVPKLEAWQQKGEATGDILPQEYATLTGELLLTLPQQLEPFTSTEVKNARATPRALSDVVRAEQKALAVSSGDRSVSSEESAVDSPGSTLALQWVGTLCRGTMAWYVMRVIDIPTLSDHGCRQLSADVDYLANVVSALGVQVDPALSSLQRQLAPDAAAGPPEGASLVEKQIAMILGKLRTTV
jgi:conserved oligomeric Golgi complex subunit 7